MKFETNNYIYRFLYKRDKPKALMLAGVIVALFSIGGLVYMPLFGVVMAIGSVGLLTWESGIELNIEDRKYRLINSFGPVGFGDWDDIPPLKCVSVFKTNLVSNTYSRTGMAVTNREAIIQVSLATESNQRIRLCDTEEAAEAFEFATELAKEFNLKVWDATSRDQKWYKAKGRK
jgi:hypothetical protein